MVPLSQPSPLKGRGLYGRSPPQAGHPLRKKTLSYMTRLCQPSSRLFQYADKSDGCQACGRGQEPTVACPTGAAVRRPHKADLS
jgi:hypothetical protein